MTNVNRDEEKRYFENIARFKKIKINNNLFGSEVDSFLRKEGLQINENELRNMK